MPPPEPVPPPRSAFVLGGGGLLGAGEVGMLRALLEAGVVPDLVVGTSVGAVNGAFLAAEPAVATTVRLAELWRELSAADGGVFAGSWGARVGTALRSRTHLHRSDPLRALLTAHLPVQRIEDLAVPFQCVAASVERAAEHWFDSGPLVEAVLASAAVPGLLPPVRIGDEHFLDGGLVNSIPVSRAVELGATIVWVLQVGRVSQPLSVPTRPWEVALVAFEIARRHRFAADMASLPGSVTVHVLPTGDEVPTGLASLRYRDARTVVPRVERAHAATAAYLAAL
ncbi:MAG: Serine protease [uncultured Frankineae bacterium]|uniref:Serine protease n=1 Tax=uncultured Frankineae bacterium TaxID=437475 RepID=A0A6J4LAQ8_9ACTN|nr:MAG: Serine protease [uncultured Frankineae bacterium]